MTRGDPQFLPLDGSPFRHSVGLRRIDPARWLETDGDTAPQLLERARLISEHHDEVVASIDTPGARAAAEELRDEVARHLGAPPGDGDPLDETGVAIPDDVCLLDGDTHLLVAGVVCFANRWRLTDKIGLPLLGVHAPVPGYADELAAKVDRVLDRLGGDTVLERRNWGVLDDATLHQPAAGPPVDGITAHDAGDRLWARVERQTLRRLPATRAVVFTIRTRQRLLRDLDAAERANLAVAIATIPADSATYKGLGLLAPVISAWARLPV